MIYKDLKKWLIHWSNDNSDKVGISLVVDGVGLILDTPLTIMANIKLIESVPEIERGTNQPAKKAKALLLEIKEAITKNNFDLSEYGYK
jgi:hypothetical protein